MIFVLVEQCVALYFESQFYNFAPFPIEVAFGYENQYLETIILLGVTSSPA